MMRSERGFTLLEVLVAVTVTAILLTSIYGVFASVSGAKDKVEKDGAGYHQARVIFDRFSREIRGIYLRQGNPNTRFLGGRDEDNHLFMELSTTATTPYGGNRGGIALVRYELQPDEESAAAKDVPWVLMRKEWNAFDPLGQNRPGYRLATGLRELRLRYYDGAEWFEEWPLSKGKAPKLVELTVLLEVDGNPLPLRSAFEVPFQ